MHSQNLYRVFVRIALCYTITLLYNKWYYDAYIEELEELEDMYMLEYYLWEHKENYEKALTQDLFRYYHKKIFSKAKIKEEFCSCNASLAQNCI